MSLKDKIREKTVGKKKQFKSETIEVDGEKIVVREPSIQDRSKILQKSKFQSAAAGQDPDSLDTGLMQVYAVIYCCYTEDGKRIFDEADKEALLDMPSGDEFLDEAGEIALDLLNLQPEEEAKN